MNVPVQYGPYQLLERVSVGGMAEVYKAKEYGVEGFERTVAVKRILPHVAEDEEFIAMFKDEAKIAVQLSHGNIAQIYNLGSHEDSFYIALEYVAGRDVRTIFQRTQQANQPMPIAQACYVLMKVCEGLDYAHNKKDKYGRELNIIHRDVSPPNILVSYEGEVKLIDFGVAKAAGRASKTQAGILKGKFGYMSPEQVRGMPLDRRSDVFSVGVVLWEVLTCQRLFQGDTDFATLEKVRAVEVPRPGELNKEIPQELEDIVFKALTREPEDRFQSAIELHDELQAFMFAQGLFYSRKDLAAWMRTHYAKEIELEKEKASQQGDTGQQAALRQRKTMMMPPGGRPPPPPPGAGRRPLPPTPGKRRPPPKPPGSSPSPRSSTPPGQPSSVPTQSHRVVSQGGGLPPKPRPPAPPGAAAGGRRKKTTVMSSATPAGLSPPAGGATRPKPAAPQPKPAAAVPRGGGSDFDWDDDELETRLFDGEGGAELVAASNRASEMASARRPGLHPSPRLAPPIAHPASAPPAAAPMAGVSIGASDPLDDEFLGPKRTPLVLVGAAVLGLFVIGGVGLMMFGDEEGAASDTKEEPAVVMPKGSLTLNTHPSGVTVKVDGSLIEGTSPFVTELEIGSHKVEVSKDGFWPFERELEVKADAPAVVAVDLVRKEVTLQLETNPKAVRLKLLANGTATPMGKGGDVFQLVRQPGVEYQVEASAKGFVSQTIPLSLDTTQNQVFKVALAREPRRAAPRAPTVAPAPKPSPDAASTPAKRPKPKKRPAAAAKTATLAIAGAAGQPPAKVSVGGKPAGKTPVPKFMVTPGAHTVKCTFPDGRSSTQRVTALDGQRVVVRCKPS